MNASPVHELRFERLAVAALALLAACEPGPPGPSAEPPPSPPAEGQRSAPEAEPPAAPVRSAAPAPPADRDVERTFAPLSRVTEIWGALTFSNRHARLAGFDGEMLLEYAGLMPATAGDELAEARVYAIRNFADYHAQNAGRNAFCSEPPRWLAVRPRALGGGSAGDVWVALLTLDDWTAYTPEIAGYCGGGAYSSSGGRPTISTSSTK